MNSCILQRKADNALAGAITAAEEKASYDAACKRLLAHKIILAWIMKSCMTEYKNYEVQEIAARFVEGEPQIAEAAVNPDEGSRTDERIQGMAAEDVSIREGTVRYDIRFHALAPSSGEWIRLIVNVEAQNDFYPGYPIVKRGIYYCSRMISSQYGTEFTDSHYEKIKKVYSIWICMNPPKIRRNTITKYLVKEENLIGEGSEKEENYDLLTVVMICMGTSQDKTHPDILKLLEVLLSSERGAEEKKRILQNEFSIAMTQTLEREVSLMCNLKKYIFGKTCKYTKNAVFMRENGSLIHSM